MSLYLLVLWPLFGAASVYLISGLKSMEKRSDSVGGTFVLICTAAELLLVAFLMTENMTAAYPRFGGFGLGFRFGSFTALFCLTTAFVWLMTALFSRDYISGLENPPRFYSFYLVSLSSVIGFFMAADFFTLFLFAGMMSLSLFPLIAHDEKHLSLKNAGAFLSIALAGALFILMGMLVLYKQIGSLSYNTVYTFSAYTSPRMLLVSGICMFAGFGAAAGIFPLHVWLPGANVSIPAPAGAVINAVITQCGLFGIITVTADMLYKNVLWTDILIWTGTAAMVWGAVCAVFSDDLKRIFTYASMSQTGLILTGTGLFNTGGSVYASSGVILHMLNHSLIMLVLFGSAGVVYKKLHSLELDDIRGFGQGKPLLNAVFLSGALGLCGIPMWNGYISRALLHESIAQSGSLLLEILFLLSGGLLTAVMAKVYIVLFISGRKILPEPETGYADSQSRAALVLSAAALPLIGLFPNTTARSIVNFSLKKLRALFLEPIYFFSGEMLTRAFIAMMIGIAFYALLFYRSESKKRMSGICHLPRDGNGKHAPQRFTRALFGGVYRLIDAAFDAAASAAAFADTRKKTGRQNGSQDGSGSERFLARGLPVFLLIVSALVCAGLFILMMRGFFIG